MEAPAVSFTPCSTKENACSWDPIYISGHLAWMLLWTANRLAKQQETSFAFPPQPHSERTSPRVACFFFTVRLISQLHSKKEARVLQESCYQHCPECGNSSFTTRMILGIAVLQVRVFVKYQSRKTQTPAHPALPSHQMMFFPKPGL